MNVELIAFTDRGAQTAERIAQLLTEEGAQAHYARGFGGQKVDFRAWTAQTFAAADALIFVGAAGIAVRAVAPHVQSKAHDPAVLVVDEHARFVIPVLAGHIGGGNALAVRLAAQLGAQAVITTATDLNGVFAVDVWATRQGLAIRNPERIKAVSGALLRGESVRLCTEVKVAGALPAGVVPAGGNAPDLILSDRANCPPGALQLVPRRYALGVGCRRGVDCTAVQAAFDAALRQENLSPLAVFGVFSIDLKAHEAGLLAFCAQHRLPFTTYSAHRLAEAEGAFSESAFVRETTGVGNVCERSAVLGSGGGALILKKYAAGGVTIALARREICYEFGGTGNE